MKRMFRGGLSRAMWVAIGVVAVTLIGGTASAVTTDFLLNTSNTGKATTGLNASGVNGKALQVTNTNTGSSATALGLSVASGHVPFTVNSTTQVPKLNASLLGGIPAGGFVQGKGSTYGNAVAIPNNSTGPTLTVVPGLMSFTPNCIGSIAEVQLTNISSTDSNFFVNDAASQIQPTPGWMPLPPGAPYIQDAPDGGTVFIFSVQGIVNNVQTVATIVLGAVSRSGFNDCHFQVQATTSHQ
jgi:hypothetical protein